MATPAQRTNTWILNEWYDQSVAGTTGGYVDPQGLYTWGRNEYQEGSLGLNDTDNRSSPVQLGGEGWNSVANSTAGGIATKSNGTLWSWGYNGSGELGLNQASPGTKISSPTQIGTGTDWAKVHDRSEGQTSFATKTDGSLWGWGNNGRGGLADNTNVSKSSPVQIPGTWANAVIHGGDGQLIALKSDGSLWSWGYGQFGVLGLNKGSESGNLKISSPTQIPGTWSHVGQGYYNGYAVKSGKLYGWGLNGQGTLQTGDNVSHSSPVQIGTDTDWGGPVSGYRYGVLAIKSTGKLYGWGEQDNSDRAGCLGQNSLADIPAPTLVGTETTWHDVTIGSSGVANALKTDGTLWSWGGNLNGQLGQNESPPAGWRSSPVQIPGTWNTLSQSSVACQNQMAIKGTAPG